MIVQLDEQVFDTKFIARISPFKLYASQTTVYQPNGYHYIMEFFVYLNDNSDKFTKLRFSKYKHEKDSDYHESIKTLTTAREDLIKAWTEDKSLVKIL